MAVIENDVIKVTVSNSSSKNVIRVSPGVAALSSVSISLNELNNVDTSGITNGQTIVYNNGSFVAGDSGAVESINGEFPDAEGDVAIDFSVDGLSDVTAPSPSEGDILKYESNRWVNDSLGKADVGLNNVDNTSDSDKPVSTATQTALDAKANTSAVPVSLNDLSDVSIVGTPTKNTTLLYDETANAFKFQPSFTNRFEDEAENNKQAIVPFVERVYTVKTDGDGIFIDSQSDTPTAGKVIKRKIYHKVGFIASGDLIGDYTLVHTFADDIAYSATESVFEGFRDGDTYGTAPFTLIQTWEEVTAAPSFTGLLNETYGSGAEAAYSTRRLNGNYSGDCMTIRRASDSTTQSIGFVGEEIDESAIETFCSGTTCTVSEWKDQSGNGNHATAAAPANEPTIYTGGALVKDGGRVALTSTGSTSFDFTRISDINSVFSVLRPTNFTTTRNSFILGDTVNSDYHSDYNGGWLGTNSATVVRNGANYLNGSSVTLTALTRSTGQYVLSMIHTSNTARANTISQDRNAQYGQRSWIGNRQELIIYSDDRTNDRTDIEENVGDYFTQNTPLLDTYSGAAAAYSLRLLDSTYTGPAIEVYAGTNGTADIGFNVFGELDTVALAAHCGNQDGTVRTWYDQSSNGNHATQTVSTANQPKIYDGATATVVTENEKPAIDFPTAVNLFSSISQSASNYAFVIVQKRNANTGFFYDSESGRLIVFIHTNGLYNTTADGTIGSQDQGLNQEVQFMSLVSPNSGALYVNGSASQTGLTYTQTALGGITSLGSNYNSYSRSINALVQEVIIYPSDQSDYRTNIEDNINTFYNIYS